MRSPDGSGSSTAFRYDTPGCGRLVGSSSDGPTTWSSTSAASATVLVSGPYTAVVPYSQCASCSRGTRPYDVLRPKQPVKLAGMRIEPPPSPAVTSGRTQAAIAAAEPPLDPPGVRSRFQGERVTPKR